MSLLDSTYFHTGLVAIPNLQGVGSVPTAAVENLNWYIATYEPEYLKSVLGETLYNAFIAGLAVVPIASRWAALRDKLRNATAKTSMISGFVFYQHECSRLSFNSGMGQAQPKAQNSELVINSKPARKAYNLSMDEGDTLRTWIYSEASTYPEFTVSELPELDHLIPW